MRKFKRLPVQSVGFVVEDKKPAQVSILDFSRMGLSFVSTKKLTLRSFISIVYQNEHDQTIQMKVFVKNVSQTSQNLFRIGTQFVAVESRN